MLILQSQILMIQVLPLWLLATAVGASPQVAFPFNSQVPPLALVGQAFQFSFSPTTFVPNDQNFQYSLTGAPSWLSLDSATRTLWGTPGASDTGPKVFTITATDKSGSTGMPATIIVTTEAPPRIGAGLTSQLAKMGTLAGPTTVTLGENEPFDFTFSSDTFIDDGKQLYFYATLVDHTPLPAWVSFDPNHLRFTGTTPQLSASPQSFEILLIASHVVGLAGSSTSFTMTVADHQFAFSPCMQYVDANNGAPLNFLDLRNQLRLDGKPAEDSDIGYVSADVPQWLSFDAHTLALTGMPPV